MTCKIREVKIVPQKETDNVVLEVTQDRLCSIAGDKFFRWQVIETRADGNLAGKAFWLNQNYTWEIVIDDVGVKCLLPLKK
jgi:hypothetical protein